MCMSGLHWARVAKVVYGATIGDAAQAGFNELPIDAAKLIADGQSSVKLEGGMLADARAVSETPPYGPAGTFSGFDVREARDEPIDHVFVGAGTRVIRHGVITQHDAGRLPSDHYPVLADIAGGACPAAAD